MSGKRGWFADVDLDVKAGPPKWQPCFETGHGHVPSFAIWFDTEEECLGWIRENILGAGLLDSA